MLYQTRLTSRSYTDIRLPHKLELPTDPLLGEKSGSIFLQVPPWTNPYSCATAGKICHG